MCHFESLWIFKSLWIFMHGLRIEHDNLWAFKLFGVFAWAFVLSYYNS